MSSNQTLPYSSAISVTLVVNKANCWCELLLLSSHWLRNNSVCGRKRVLTGSVWLFTGEKEATAVIEHLGSARGAQQHMLIHDLRIENVCLRLSTSLCSIGSWTGGGICPS